MCDVNNQNTQITINGCRLAFFRDATFRFRIVGRDLRCRNSFLFLLRSVWHGARVTYTDIHIHTQRAMYSHVHTRSRTPRKNGFFVSLFSLCPCCRASISRGLSSHHASKGGTFSCAHYGRSRVAAAHQQSSPRKSFRFIGRALVKRERRTRGNHVGSSIEH